MIPPSVASIEALERVRRLGSAQKAAEALSITPSAVSHRLRALEAALGFPVVASAGRGLTVTRRALRFLDDARPALAALEDAARAASTLDERGGSLTIAAAAGIAAAWLCPRVGEIRARTGATEISLLSGEAEADATILFAPASAPLDAAEFLLRPDFFPVCAPGLAHGAGGTRAASWLATQTFLHLYDERDWRMWLAATGRDGAALDVARREGRTATFGDANLLLAAAMAGQGVALGDPITCGGALERGALVRPMAGAALSERAYYLTVRSGAGAPARRFGEWIRAELPRT